MQMGVGPYLLSQTSANVSHLSIELADALSQLARPLPHRRKREYRRDELLLVRITRSTSKTHLIVVLADLLDLLLLLADEAIQALEVELLAIRVLDSLDERSERLKVLRCPRCRIERNLLNVS